MISVRACNFRDVDFWPASLPIQTFWFAFNSRTTAGKCSILMLKSVTPVNCQPTDFQLSYGASLPCRDNGRRLAACLYIRHGNGVTT